MLDARSKPAVAVKVLITSTRETASDRQHLSTAWVVGGYIQKRERVKKMVIICLRLVQKMKKGYYTRKYLFQKSLEE